MPMIEVHQCPRCDLRFASKAELEFHFDDEHVHPRPLSAAHRAAPVRLDAAGVAGALARLPGWRGTTDAIEKTFEFPSFPEAIAFVDRVAVAAEEANHHPDIDIRYRTVRLVLTTHSHGGVTNKDVELAAAVDALAGG